MQNFADVEDLPIRRSTSGLTSQVSDSFSLATMYTACYENKPLPHVESLDSDRFPMSLVYSFF